MTTLGHLHDTDGVLSAITMYNKTTSDLVTEFITNKNKSTKYHKGQKVILDNKIITVIYDYEQVLMVRDDKNSYFMEKSEIQPINY